MKTKIIATIGPSSYNLDVLKKMKKNGMDIIRINMKYINFSKLKKVCSLAKKVNSELMIDVKNIKKVTELSVCSFEYLAVSFASSGRQIRRVRKMVNSEKVKIIAKIENRKGLENLDSIIDASDGIMVARGDLSKNIRFERIPIRQKEIIKKCRKKNKISITATEMLHSMVNNKKPLNSEVTDIANAVFDGSNILMLSEETAIGNYPSLAVKTMKKIIREAERDRKNAT